MSFQIEGSAPPEMSEEGKTPEPKDLALKTVDSSDSIAPALHKGLFALAQRLGHYYLLVLSGI